MNSSSPLGLFITWTVYGTFLPGDSRGWRHRSSGVELGRPLLESWHRDRLNHDVVLLVAKMRAVVEAAIREVCTIRVWTLWAVSVRSNHVHVVVTAPRYKPILVRDQLKAKATRELRQSFDIWQNRPVWTEKGDIEFLDNESEIEQCVVYVTDVQDRKGRDSM
jgi:REP element-mobilizing transposase RayT